MRFITKHLSDGTSITYEDKITEADLERLQPAKVPRSVALAVIVPLLMAVTYFALYPVVGSILAWLFAK